MNKLVILLAALLIGLTAGCTQESKKEEQTEGGRRRLEVVATTGIIADMVKNIGGNLVNVTVLIGADTDPHQYRPGDGEIKLMAQADIILYNGLNLEAAMADVLERVGSKVRTMAVTEGIDKTKFLRSQKPGEEYDPHVWFDPRMWMMAVEHVRNALAQMDPDYAEVYMSDAQVYLDQIAELHNFVYQEAQLIPVERKVLVTAHDAFRYFGREYGFNVRSVQGISTASEASEGSVRELARFMVARKVPVIFPETCLSQKGIDAVKDAIADQGFDVKIGASLCSDAVGAPGTPQGTYIGMVQHNIQTIVTALKGDADVVLP